MGKKAKKKKKKQKVPTIHLDEFQPFKSARDTGLIEGFSRRGRGRGRGRGGGRFRGNNQRGQSYFQDQNKSANPQGQNDGNQGQNPASAVENPNFPPIQQDQ